PDDYFSFGYGFNLHLPFVTTFGGNAAGGDCCIKANHLKATNYLIGDTNIWPGNGTIYMWPGVFSGPPYSNVSQRHGGGKNGKGKGNMLFIDGHVEPVAPLESYRLNNVIKTDAWEQNW